jgi:hypothetical protein
VKQPGGPSEMKLLGENQKYDAFPTLNPMTIIVDSQLFGPQASRASIS